MKVPLLVSALVAVLMPFAAAQDNDRLPQASLDREINIPRAAGTVASGRLPQAQTPPSYCKPCLFYAGDWDPYASDANGLANELDLIVSTGAAVYTPFIVPKGKTWTVTGLFTSNIFTNSEGHIDPKVLPYEVRKNIPKAGGNGGQLVCHGRRPATLVYQGNFPFHDPYHGPNSADGRRMNHQTATGTLYFDVRPWQGGEFIFDPEFSGGEGLNAVLLQFPKQSWV